MNIREIADLAGVSPATVSRVFSHQPGIREEVREKVLSVARKQGYHPRFSSRQKNVVIITPQNSDFPAYSCVEMLLMALTRTLPARGFRLEILPCNNLERLSCVQFCGAVAIGCEAGDFKGWEESYPVPLIIMDRPQTGRRSPLTGFVRSDEMQGMKLAIDHLRNAGCRKIGCIIHGNPGTGNAQIRCDGIKRALEDSGITQDPRLIAFSGDGNERYVELIGKMLKYGADSLFCPGGNAGIAGAYALSLFNRQIPEDLSLITSEQNCFSRYATPPQTTISPDYDALASAVAEELEQWMASGKLSGCRTLPYHLIHRESVRSN